MALQRLIYKCQKSLRTHSLLFEKPEAALYELFLYVSGNIDSAQFGFSLVNLSVLPLRHILQLEIWFLAFLTANDKPNNKIL